MARTFHFSMGEALARSLACFGKNFLPLALLGLLVFTPLALLMLDAGEKAWARASEFRGDDGYEILSFNQLFWGLTQQGLGVGGTLLSMLGLPLLLHALVTLGVFQFLRGEGMQYGRSVARGLARLFPVLFVVIFILLIAFLAMFPAGLLLTGLARGGMVGGLIGGLLVLGIIVLIMCVFFVAIQSAVVERVGPAKAMSRSSALTRGARWKIFGILLIIGLVDYVVTLIIQTAFVGDSPSGWSQARLGILVLVGVGAILAMLKAVCAAVVYHDLRRAKEGVGIDELIKVFD